MLLKREDRRISIIGGLVLVALTLAAGISVYVVMQRQAESILSRSLEASLQNKKHLFESQIDQGIASTRAVTTRLFPIQNLQLLDADPGNTKAQQEMQRIAQSFLLTGFAAMSFYDAQGNEVAHAGHFSQNLELRIPLSGKDHVFLLWDGQFILHAGMDMLDQQGSRIGIVMTETNLPLLTRAFLEVKPVGKTGEIAVCAPMELEKDMQCFMSRASGLEFKRQQRFVQGRALPMNYAL